MSEKGSELFIFKQSYKSRNLPSTRVLNQKHLVYIATRPGVMRNRECGFGLWGKLLGMKASQDISDLRTAYQAVGTASENHTLYRAILSVDKHTARDYDLYDRETWQNLLNTRISVITREMHIKPEDFRWVASMHYKKGHPHVHILYWDNGKEPRQEFISEERFKLISERVRTTFSRAFYHEKELKIAQGAKDETSKLLRLQLTAMLRSANLADALDLDHVKTAELDDLGRGLVELAGTLPSIGRLKYGFLKPEYRAQLNAWLEKVLQITDFAKLEQSYLKLSADVTRLYGNDNALAETFQKQAREQLFKDLGNETLGYLKGAVLELRTREPPEDIRGLSMATWRIAGELLRSNPAFQTLLDSLPKWRTPDSEILRNEDVKNQIDALCRTLAGDVRVRSKAVGYVANAGGQFQPRQRQKEANSACYRAVHAAIAEAVGQKLGNPIPGEALFGQDVPKDAQALGEAVRRTAGNLLEDSPTFAALLKILPKGHRPTDQLLREEAVKEQVNTLIHELTHDLRIRSKVDRFTAETADDKASARAVRSAAYQDLYRSMNKLVMETARQELGYDAQEQREMATMALLRIFCGGSQSKNQLQSQRDMQREKYRNLSETAKRNLRKRRQQEGGWSMEV